LTPLFIRTFLVTSFGIVLYLMKTIGSTFLSILSILTYGTKEKKSNKNLYLVN